MMSPAILTTGGTPVPTSLSAAPLPSPQPVSALDQPEPVLTLYAPLGEGPAAADGHELARQVWALERLGHRAVHVRINSPGGSVAHGYSFFSALRHTRMHVHTWLDGLALSMAGLIFLAGRTRHVSPWGMLMLHDPALDGEAMPADDMSLPSAEAKPGASQGAMGPAVMLARVRAAIVRMYAVGSGLSEPVLSRMMADETWLGASDCLRLGLAHDTGGEALRPTFEVQARARLLGGGGPRGASREVAAIEARWRGLMASGARRSMSESIDPMAGTDTPVAHELGAALWRMISQKTPLTGGPWGGACQGG